MSNLNTYIDLFALNAWNNELSDKDFRKMVKNTLKDIINPELFYNHPDIERIFNEETK